MRTKIQGLSQPSIEILWSKDCTGPASSDFGPAGHAPNPCVAATFLILDPAPFAGRYIRTRLYYHDRALWKLRWFLHDFNYDADLLAADELDARQVVGLEGVIRLAYWGNNGHRRLDVQGFAPSECWGETTVPSPLAKA